MDMRYLRSGPEVRQRAGASRSSRTSTVPVDRLSCPTGPPCATVRCGRIPCPLPAAVSRA